MSIFYAFHVVTEHRMYLGQHIIFDENHHNGVYKRVMDKLPVVNDIYAHPDKYTEKELDYPTMVALRELALEEVRIKIYPSYPSRMACLYVSNDLSAALDWAEYFIKIGRPTFQIVKIKVNGNIFTGDAVKCFDGTIDKSSNLIMAERYWRNEDNSPDEPPINEILVSGDLEVAEILKEYGNT